MSLALPSLIFTDQPARKRADFEHLPDSEIFHLLAKAHDKQDASRDGGDDDAYDAATSDVKAMTEVLEARGTLTFKITRGL